MPKTTKTESQEAVAPGGNGRHPRRSDGKIRVAIIGVGNCASSLVQGGAAVCPRASRRCPGATARAVPYGCDAGARTPRVRT